MKGIVNHLYYITRRKIFQGGEYMVYAWELEYLEKWSTREIKNQIWMAVSCHQPIQGSVSLDVLRAELVRRGDSPNGYHDT